MSDDNTPLQYKDCLGNEIHVGDFVAYAVGRSHAGALNVALVTELTTKYGRWNNSQRAAVKVRIYDSSGYYDVAEKKWVNNVYCARAATTYNLGDMVIVDRIPAALKEFLLSDEKRREINVATKKIGDIDNTLDSL